MTHNALIPLIENPQTSVALLTDFILKMNQIEKERALSYILHHKHVNGIVACVHQMNEYLLDMSPRDFKSQILTYIQRLPKESYLLVIDEMVAAGIHKKYPFTYNYNTEHFNIGNSQLTQETISFEEALRNKHQDVILHCLHTFQEQYLKHVLDPILFSPHKPWNEEERVECSRLLHIIYHIRPQVFSCIEHTNKQLFLTIPKKEHQHFLNAPENNIHFKLFSKRIADNCDNTPIYCIYDLKCIIEDITLKKRLQNNLNHIYTSKQHFNKSKRKI